MGKKSFFVFFFFFLFFLVKFDKKKKKITKQQYAFHWKNNFSKNNTSMDWVKKKITKKIKKNYKKIK